MFDPRDDDSRDRHDDSRDLSRGGRARGDGRQRDSNDPRDVLMRDLDLPRGHDGKFKKERDIPMQPDAQAALVEQIEAENRLWKQNPQRLREVVARGAERAKIPRITPHALRHTFGTRWLQAGGDIYKLSKILGHSSVAVTEAHYAHLLKEDLVAASQQVRLPIANRSKTNVLPIGRHRA
jgi:integrase